MRAFGVTVPEVAAAVRAQNLEVPGGRVDEGARELTVRTLGRITNPSKTSTTSPSRRAATTRSNSATSATPKTARRNCARARA
jgi:multidrug efflux pump subunit AcrB